MINIAITTNKIKHSWWEEQIPVRSTFRLISSIFQNPILNFPRTSPLSLLLFVNCLQMTAGHNEACPQNSLAPFVSIFFFSFFFHFYCLVRWSQIARGFVFLARENCPWPAQVRTTWWRRIFNERTSAQLACF